MNARRLCLLVYVLVAMTTTASFALEPWIITTEVVVDEPIDVGDVIIAGNGSLTVLNVPEPGLRVEGNIWAIHNGQVRLENSVIQFLSTYHGQYTLIGAENSSISIVGCDYRVPMGVQHSLTVAGEAELLAEDTDFDEVQLGSADTAHFSARRLNGNFEVIVQNDSSMELADIPRDPGEGSLWVWVEFPDGSEAEYSPPMPGFVETWVFPPEDAQGIVQQIVMERCETLLWPMLVREGSQLTLRDIAEENWVVVGLYLPHETKIDGLWNGANHEDTILDFEDRTLRLVDASVDTWNLYPWRDGVVRVRDSLLGEILSFHNSRVHMTNTTIDGSGGFFGARNNSTIVAVDSTFTCTIEAAQDSTIELHKSVVSPYPQDPTGDFTRFGAYDNARLFVDQTPVFSTPALGGQGLLAVTFFADPPLAPPVAPTTLHGSAAIFSLDESTQLESWRFETQSRWGEVPLLIADGNENVENDDLGVWGGADPGVDHMLRLVLTDNLGRTLSGFHRVVGDGPQVRGGVAGRRNP